jgi:uncharacterized membrane protein YbaN (DUF454 family)
MATVEIINDTDIRIQCRSAFADEQQRLRFLGQVFGVAAIRSVEIDTTQGIAILRRDPKSDPLIDVLKQLEGQLLNAPSEYPVLRVPYELPRKSGPFGYVRPPVEIEGLRKPLYRALGIFFVGMSVVGIMSPFVPTSPFVLLSSYFLIRSSRDLHDRLVATRVFGPIIDDYYVRGGLRWSMKRNTLVFMGAGFIGFSALSGFAPGTVLAMAAASLVSFTLLMSLPTIDESHFPFRLEA